MVDQDIITNLDEAIRVLDKATETVLSAGRLKRSEMMRVLKQVYSIKLSELDRDRLMDHIIEHRKLEGANKAFIMKRSSGYTLPLRYIFPSHEDRSNVSRYSGALDTLARNGVSPSNFTQAVRDGGGIAALYWESREHITKIQRRSKLTLDRNIEVQKGKLVHLQLYMQPNGIFHVIDYDLSEPSKEAAE